MIGGKKKTSQSARIINGVSGYLQWLRKKKEAGHNEVYEKIMLGEI